MERINTNNYRVCKQIIGVARTRSVLSIFNNEQDCRDFYSSIEKEVNWEYSLELEVIYKGTQFDSYGNPIDSSPCWIRL
jgi:hypothetical protein